MYNFSPLQLYQLCMMCLTRMLIEDLHLHYIIVCDVFGMHYWYILFPLAL